MGGFIGRQKDRLTDKINNFIRISEVMSPKRKRYVREVGKVGEDCTIQGEKEKKRGRDIQKETVREKEKKRE